RPAALGARPDTPCPSASVCPQRRLDAFPSKPPHACHRQVTSGCDSFYRASSRAYRRHLGSRRLGRGQPPCTRRPDARVEPVVTKKTADQKRWQPFGLTELTKSPASQTNQRPDGVRTEKTELIREMNARSSGAPRHGVGEIQVLDLVIDNQNQNEGDM